MCQVRSLVWIASSGGKVPNVSVEFVALLPNRRGARRRPEEEKPSVRWEWVYKTRDEPHLVKRMILVIQFGHMVAENNSSFALQRAGFLVNHKREETYGDLRDCRFLRKIPKGGG